MTADASKQAARPTKTRTKRERYGGIVCRDNPWVRDGRTDGQIVVRHTSSDSEELMVFAKTSDEASTDQARAGFWTSKEVDVARLVKLYVGSIRVLQDLSPAATKVFEILYREVQKRRELTSVILRFDFVDQEITPISETVFFRGIRELVAKEFIAPSPAGGLFWINPSYIWEGDRLVFANEYILEGSEAARWHRAHLQVSQRQSVLPFESPDCDYSPELKAHDPFFDRATQAEIRRRIRETPPEQYIPFDPNDPESRERVLGAFNA